MTADFPEPDWNQPDSVALALQALRDAHDEESSLEASDRFLWSVGDNQTGTFYPVVLSVLPEIGRILADGGFWAQRATLESLIDLGGTFVPEPGHELHLGAPVQGTLQRFIGGLRPLLARLAERDDARCASARELIELIDDLAN